MNDAFFSLPKRLTTGWEVIIFPIIVQKVAKCITWSDLELYNENIFGVKKFI